MAAIKPPAAEAEVNLINCLPTTYLLIPAAMVNATLTLH
jgi:hypothetical protein